MTFSVPKIIMSLLSISTVPSSFKFSADSITSSKDKAPHYRGSPERIHTITRYASKNQSHRFAFHFIDSLTGQHQSTPRCVSTGVVTHDNKPGPRFGTSVDPQTRLLRRGAPGGGYLLYQTSCPSCQGSNTTPDTTHRVQHPQNHFLATSAWAKIIRRQLLPLTSHTVVTHSR